MATNAKLSLLFVPSSDQNVTQFSCQTPAQVSYLKAVSKSEKNSSVTEIVEQGADNSRFSRTISQKI